MGPAYAKGMLLFQQRRYRDAVEQFQNDLAADPTSAHAHAMLALSLLNDGQPPIAHAAAKEAIRIDPECAFAHYAMSLVLLQTDAQPPPSMPRFVRSWVSAEEAAKIYGALESLKRAIALNPNDADYMSLLSFLEGRLGKWRASLKTAERGLKISPTHVECAIRRHHALRELGRLMDADDEALRALSLEPEYATTHFMRGWSSLEQGMWLQAQQHFLDSLRLDPTEQRVRFGLFLARLGRVVPLGWLIEYVFWSFRLFTVPTSFLGLFAVLTLCYCHITLKLNWAVTIGIVISEIFGVAAVAVGLLHAFRGLRRTMRNRFAHARR